MTTVELYYSDTCRDCHQLRTILMEIIPRSMKFKEINISYPEGQRRVFVGRTSREEIIREIRTRES
ncbi:MAG: hypothetical protein O8C59_01285 [Candidatus Methanoperedens sp.]|nr:hypothetical protein [Candidatus Methanoperedens sp.]